MHLSEALAQNGHEVIALSINRRAQIQGVKCYYYKPERGSSQSIHPLASDFETKLIRAEACASAALQLKNQGFSAQIIYAHTGWGESLFLKDIWPKAKLLGYFELFYQAEGADCGFDPEFSEDPYTKSLRIRAKNANNLLSLEGADHGVSPTNWQYSTFPKLYQSKLSIINDGINTEYIRPDPSAQIHLMRDNLTLNPDDEIITFANRNLEPLRGYHRFIRALPEILSRRPNAHVLIIGGDEVSYGIPPKSGQSYRELFFNEIKNRVDISRIHFLGKISYSSFVNVLQISTVHVYLTYPFVLSWSMMEAMSAAALVIGSSTEPVKEVIQHGENGFLVDFFSTSELVEAVCEGLAHRKLMVKIRQQARQTIYKSYDLHGICLPKQLKLIEQL